MTAAMTEKASGSADEAHLDDREPIQQLAGRVGFTGALLLHLLLVRTAASYEGMMAGELTAPAAWYITVGLCAGSLVHAGLTAAWLWLGPQDFQSRERVVLAYCVGMQLLLPFDNHRVIGTIWHGQLVDRSMLHRSSGELRGSFLEASLIIAFILVCSPYVTGLVRSKLSWINPAVGAFSWTAMGLIMCYYDSARDRPARLAPQPATCAGQGGWSDDNWLGLGHSTDSGVIMIACAGLMSAVGWIAHREAERSAAISRASAAVAREAEAVARQNTQLLLEANQQLERTQQQDRELSAMIYHEIRNPLNGVVSNLRVASDPAVDPTEHIQVALGCSEQAMSFLNRMQALEKLRGGAWELSSERVELLSVLKLAVDGVAPQLAPGVRMTRQFGGSKGCWVELDHLLLRGVLTNLLQNAARFTKAGQISLKCECVEQDDGHVVARLAVCDTGPGMSPELCGSVFNKYVSHGGIGIGLFLANQQVKALGGKLTAKSPRADGVAGAGFYFDLRMKLTEPEPEPEPESEPVLPSQLRVLLADDIATNRGILRMILKTHVAPEWDISEVSTAEALLKAVSSEQPPELVITDEDFGGTMRGSEAIKRIRQMEATDSSRRRLCIVSCTGNCQDEDVEFLCGCGADQVWPKPFPDFWSGDLQRSLCAAIQKSSPRWVWC